MVLKYRQFKPAPGEPSEDPLLTRPATPRRAELPVVAVRLSVFDNTTKGQSMKRFTLLLLGLVAVFALAGTAASSALASGPTLLFLGSERTLLLVSLPLDGSGTGKNTTPTELQSSLTDLVGKGDLLELTLLQTPEGVKGNYSVLFLEVEEVSGRTKCNTKGDKIGEVLLPLNEAELVYWNTASGELQAGIIFQVKEFTIECNSGAATIKIKGSDLGSIAKADTGERTTIFGGVRCSSTRGTPEKTKYTNFKGEAKEAELKVTTGGRTVSGCELIGNTSTFETELSIESTSPSQMATLDF
jgi:hypothetical protein